ncbi:hypothetical protein [Methanothrix soehngenii]|jgi:iron complex transport system substrate-binding protein|uniref:hypothetical protein n=1 Tax=Methanothrix soehngenii TaxID=2223 RepID=UPI0023F17CEF|nr:hypothetical protein [Methanothrix soehngenii]
MNLTETVIISTNYQEINHTFKDISMKDCDGIMNRAPKIFLILLIVACSAGLCSSAARDQINDPVPGNYLLGIFGNANMDETIDELDIAYLEGVINGTNAPTNLSDANYDGSIDDKDVEQVEKIISGDETTLVLLDSSGKVVTIEMPVERIIPVNRNAAEALRTIKASDEIVGFSDSALNDK